MGYQIYVMHKCMDMLDMISIGYTNLLIPKIWIVRIAIVIIAMLLYYFAWNTAQLVHWLFKKRLSKSARAE